jgi:hypothetical protein
MAIVRFAGHGGSRSGIGMPSLVVSLPAHGRPTLFYGHLVGGLRAGTAVMGGSALNHLMTPGSHKKMFCACLT